MKFSDQNYFMHNRAMDICIRVVKVQYKGPKYVKMKVEIINLGYTGKPYVMMRNNNFVVESTEYDNWVWLLPAAVFTVRTQSGLPTLSIGENQNGEVKVF